MAFLVAVLFVVAKALLLVLAGVVLLALLLIVLPVRATVHGECAVEGDPDAFAEAGEARFEEAPEPVITVIPAGMARATVLGGLLGVEYCTDGPLKVLLAGAAIFRLTSGRRARSKTPSPEGREAALSEGSLSVKGRRKKGFLKVLKFRRSSRAKATSGSAGKKKGFSLAVKVREIRRWLSPEVRELGFRTAKGLVKILHLRGHVHAECGFGDPGMTGMTYAAFVTWSGMTSQRWLTLKPNFVDCVIHARVEGETWFLPVQVAYLVGRFLLSREIRPLWRKKRARESRKAPALGAHTSG